MLLTGHMGQGTAQDSQELHSFGGCLSNEAKLGQLRMGTLYLRESRLDGFRELRIHVRA